MKTNKKGFTLIEVIAVVVILGIILLLVSIPVSKYIFNSKMKTYKSHQKDLEVATKNYMIDCLANDEGNCNLPTSSKSVTVSYNKLVSLGYSDELKDPEGEGYCDKSYVIAEQKSSNGVDIEYKSCLICDNYKTDEEWCVIEEVSCTLEVEGTNEDGKYTSSVNVTLKPIGNDIEEWGIVTDINNLEYNGLTKATIKEQGNTTIYGIVKNSTGKEGVCSKTINIDFDAPEADIYMGYEIYPKENSATNNNTITINNLSKYGEVSGVLVEFSSSLTTSSTGDIKSGSNSIKIDGGFLTGRDNAVFKINKGSYDSLTIDLGSSSIKDAVSKIRLLKNESETSVYTNKDVMVYVESDGSIDDISGYSYDNGNTYITSNMKTFDSNTTGKIILKDAFDNVSEPYDYKISTIDKEVPTIKVDYTTAKYDWGYYINNIKFSSDDNIQKIEIVEKTTNVVPTSSDTIIDITEIKERNYSNIKNDQYLFVRLTDNSGNVSQWYKYNIYIGGGINIDYYNVILTSGVGNGYTRNLYKCTDANCSSEKNEDVYIYDISEYGEDVEGFLLSDNGSSFYKMIIKDNSNNFELSKIMYLKNFYDETSKQSVEVTILPNMVIESIDYDEYVYDINTSVTGNILKLSIEVETQYEYIYSCPEGTELDYSNGTCTGSDYEISGGSSWHCVQSEYGGTYWATDEWGDESCGSDYHKKEWSDEYCEDLPETCSVGDEYEQSCYAWCRWQGNFDADVWEEEYYGYYTAAVVFK